MSSKQNGVGYEKALTKPQSKTLIQIRNKHRSFKQSFIEHSFKMFFLNRSTVS